MNERLTIFNLLGVYVSHTVALFLLNALVLSLSQLIISFVFSHTVAIIRNGTGISPS